MSTWTGKICVKVTQRIAAKPCSPSRRHGAAGHGRITAMIGISRTPLFVLASLGWLSLPGAAQQARHGRGYKPPPPTAQVVITVEKGFNERPLPNASVVFRATRDEKVTANLETKTDPDGKASLDLLEVGSHVTVQVIAGGFATYATDFDLTDQGKQILVKLERPRAQVSGYGENGDRPAVTQPGIQERAKRLPAPADPGNGTSVSAPTQSPATPPPSGSPQ